MSNVLRRAFLDISNGYSVMKYNGQSIYIKHLSHREHLNLDELEAESIKYAQKSSIPTEKEQLEYLISNNLWTKKKDNEIKEQREYILSMRDNMKNITLPSVLENTLKQVKDAELKLIEMEFAKRNLLGLTCESYAAKLVHEQYIVKSLYKDDKLTEKFYSEDEFNDISDQELDDIVTLYNKTLDDCSDLNIKKLAIQDFFQSYYFLCDDDLYAFWGKPIVNFTYLQVKLANNAKYYKYLFENNDISSLPENVRNDPEKLTAYINTTKKGKEAIDKNEGDAVGMVGATKQDLELLGVKNAKSNPKEDLKDILKYFPQ